MKINCLASPYLFAIGLALPAPAATEIVLWTNMSYPGVSGTLTNLAFVQPALNNAGQIGFRAGTTSSAGQAGMFRAEPGTVDQLLFPGDPALNGSGNFQGFVDGVMSIDSAGFLTQRGFFQNSASTSGFIGADGVGPRVELRLQAPLPDGNGSISDGFPMALGGRSMILAATIVGSNGGSLDNSAIVTVAADSSRQLLAREGQTVPDGNGQYGNLSGGFVVRNESMQALVTAQVRNTTGGTADDAGLFRLGNGGPTVLARKGETTSAGVIANFIKIALADNGTAAFAGSLSGTADPPNDNGGVFHTDGTTVTKIARAGEAIPDGTGVVGT